MTSKLLICPFFGDLPDWWDRYRDEEIPRLADQGYDVLLDFDLDGFKARVKERLGVECPIEPGTGKIWDYRPALGHLYADEIDEGGYAWYGHTDFDCVYGRVSEFNHLWGYDIVTDCAHDYISGPWTLYRYSPQVTELFMKVEDWHRHLATPTITAWCEGEFSACAEEHVLVSHVNHHAYTEPEKLRRDGDRLMWGDREIAYYHFRRTKEWPL